MKRSVLTLASISTLALSLAACGGSGGGGTTPQNPTPPITPSGKATATQSISFRIPVGAGPLTAPASAVRFTKSALSTRRPQYISPDTAAFDLFIDGKEALTNVSVTTASNVASQALPSPLVGTIGYSVVISTAVGNGGNNGTGPNYTYATITANTDLLPGSHNVGAVLTAADGFVLSEDQETFTLNGGSNPAAAFYLRGVADSAFWCDTACNGGAGTPSANGTYTLQVFATDHEGDAIAYQTNAGLAVKLDNGPVNAVEVSDTNTSGTLSIGNSGPFSNPGNAFIVDYQENGTTPMEGWSITLKCVKVGQATVALQVAGLPLSGGVTGFNYSAPINTSADPFGAAYPTNPVATPQTPVYTTANLDIGTVPVQQDFGNELTVNCDASLSMTFM